MFLVLATSAFAQDPAIFYTDLLAGPNTGGENNNGTILTIYGAFFGTNGTGCGTTTTVTIGGAAPAAYIGTCPASHLDPTAIDGWQQKISVAIGSGVTGTSQAIVVTVSGNASTCLNMDGCVFTVNAGNIYHVSTTGNDTTGTGAWASPWRNIKKAMASAGSGGIIYVSDGVTTQDCDTDSSICFNANIIVGTTTAGTSTLPKALVGYPGADVKINTLSSANTRYGLLASHAYWTIANIQFELLGTMSARNVLAPYDNWRVVGNYITNPEYYTNSGCVSVADRDNVKILGNEFTVCSYQYSAANQTHTLYVNTGSTNVEVGWNWSHNNFSCRDIQLFSEGGVNLYGIWIHDNLIHDVPCQAILSSYPNPASGDYQIWNNVIFRSGQWDTNGRISTGITLGASCRYPPSGPPVLSPINLCAPEYSPGDVLVYHNTLYDPADITSTCTPSVAGCDLGTFKAFGGTNVNTSMGQPDTVLPVDQVLSNNIFAVKPVENSVSGKLQIYTDSTGPAVGHESNGGNLFFRFTTSLTMPTWTVATDLNVDPLFTDRTTDLLTLTSSSPAVGTGVTLSGDYWNGVSPYDIRGVLRDPDNPSIGAFELAWGAAAQLDFSEQPSNTLQTVTISPSVTVRVEDSNGILVQDDNTTSCTVAIGTNPGSGTLSGTLVRTASSGICTFNNLSINNTGIGYTLTVASGGLTGDISSTFNITSGGGGSAVAYTITGFPAYSVPGLAYATCVVTAVQENDSTATSYTGTGAWTSSDASATLPANVPFVGGDAGTKTTTCPTLRTGGTQSITLTDSVNAIEGSQSSITVPQLRGARF